MEKIDINKMKSICIDELGFSENLRINLVVNMFKLEFFMWRGDLAKMEIILNKYGLEIFRTDLKPRFNDLIGGSIYIKIKPKIKKSRWYNNRLMRDIILVIISITTTYLLTKYL
jgi:hypothetical protein